MKRLVLPLMAVVIAGGCLYSCSEKKIGENENISSEEDNPFGGSSRGEDIPDNQIWYTTSDGKIIEPTIELNEKDWDFRHIVTHTYKNGKGCITFDGPVTSIGMGLFGRQFNLTSVMLPNSLKNIGDNAFSNCQFTSIVIPENVENIGERAFDFSKFTSIKIPKSVKSIGERAFLYCMDLASITFEEGSQLTSIGDEAFYVCFNDASNSQPLTIPKSVTSIGDRAFGRCLCLPSITFEEGSQLTTIGEEVFKKCEEVTSIVIPKSVTSIGKEAFSYCSNLKSVVFKEDSQLECIQERTFYECTSLINIALGKESKLYGIEKEAFYRSEGEVGAVITLPNNVKNIGNSAFYGYNSPTVICYAPEPPSTDNAFSNYWKLYVPSTSINAYKNDNFWRQFTNIYSIDNYHE